MPTACYGVSASEQIAPIDSSRYPSTSSCRSNDRKICGRPSNMQPTRVLNWVRSAKLADPNGFVLPNCGGLASFRQMAI